MQRRAAARVLRVPGAQRASFLPQTPDGYIGSTCAFTAWRFLLFTSRRDLSIEPGRMERVEGLNRIEIEHCLSSILLHPSQLVHSLDSFPVVFASLTSCPPSIRRSLLGVFRGAFPFRPFKFKVQIVSSWAPCEKRQSAQQDSLRF